MNAFERQIRRVDGFQQRHAGIAVPFGVMKKFGDDNAGSLVVQLTYTMFVTVFPLLLLAVTISSIVLADDAGLRARVATSAFAQFPIVGTQLAHNVHVLKRSSTFGIVVGLVGLAYGSLGLAQTGLYAMSQIWNIPNAERPGFLTRIARSVLFLLLLAIGLILTTGLSGFGTFGRHNVLLGYLAEVLAAAVNVGLYLGAFRVLTPKQIATNKLWRGAVLGGVLWTVLQAFGGYVVGHDLKGASATYGMFGLVLGLLAWISLGSTLTLYAAEVNTVLHHRLWPRSIVQPPLTRADQLSIALQAIQSQRRPEQGVVTTVHGAPMTQDEFREGGYQLDASAEPFSLAVEGRAGSEGASKGREASGAERAEELSTADEATEEH